MNGANAEVVRDTVAENDFNGLVFLDSDGTISQSLASGNDGNGVLV